MADTGAQSVTVDQICDYVIVRLHEAGAPSVLKLHKLLYYVQAWYLAFYGKPLFASGFQAWVHGPVNRPTYDRFKDRRSMYSRVIKRDIAEGFSPEALPDDVRQHVDIVLETYGEYADTQLEEMTHNETPWIEARKGYEPNERCEREISNATMQTYYAARLREAA